MRGAATGVVAACLVGMAAGPGLEAQSTARQSTLLELAQRDDWIYALTEADLAENSIIYGPEGCDECNGGFKGRVGIYQVMPLSEEMKRLVMEGKNSIDLADQGQKEGIPDIRQSAIKKVKDGMLSIDEMNRVTQE